MKKYKTEGYADIFGRKIWAEVWFELPDDHTTGDLYKAECKALIDWMDNNSSFDTEIKLITHGTGTAT